MIAHVVLLRLRDDLSNDDLRSFAQLFQLACREIPTIRAAKIGPIVSMDGTTPPLLGDKAYTVAACLEFDDRQGLDAYMAHPRHAELARRFWQYCESTVFADVSMVDPVTADIVSVFGLKT
jgi:hypothetical protein